MVACAADLRPMALDGATRAAGTISPHRPMEAAAPMTEPASLAPAASADPAVPAAPRVIEREAPQYNARLVRREDETESLAYFWVRFDGEPTPFEPGQYMTIGVMVDGRIVQRPYSVASPPAAVGDRRLRVLRPPGPGRHVHAVALGPAGRPPDADDRPEGQVHARRERRAHPHLHLVGDGQRPVRVDDAAAPRRRAAAQRRLPQRGLVRARARLPRRSSRTGRARAATRSATSRPSRARRTR